MTSKDTVDLNSLRSTYDSNLLPREIFSKCSYVLINYKVFSSLLALELLFFGSLYCFEIRSKDIAILTFIIGIILVAFTGFITYLCSRDTGLTDENKLVFLKEVTVARPGIDNERWNVVARRLNPIFSQNSRSATAYFFYDGEACASCFRRNFLEPYYWKKPHQEAGGGTTDSSGLNESNRLPNSSIESGLPRSELETFIEMAVKAHQESLMAYWNELDVGNSPSN